MFAKTTLIVLGATILLTLIGCAINPTSPTTGESPQAAAEPPAKGGAELWAETCSRCHNLRPADSYTDSQWDAVVQHMRLRANLDGAEARQIAEFLKASH